MVSSKVPISLKWTHIISTWSQRTSKSNYPNRYLFLKAPWTNHSSTLSKCINISFSSNFKLWICKRLTLFMVDSLNSLQRVSRLTTQLLNLKTWLLCPITLFLWHRCSLLQQICNNSSEDQIQQSIKASLKRLASHSKCLLEILQAWMLLKSLSSSLLLRINLKGLIKGIPI